MRELVLDTETTGLEPDEGHRLVEVGCVELFNRLPTGKTFHRYINPERDVPADAYRVHGLSTDFLKDHPTFAEIAVDFLDFMGTSPMIIHNAEFDLKFLDAELKSLGQGGINREKVIDSLTMAREKFPGQPNNLDALCRRFGIDISHRTTHGAIKDCELLAEVYLELKGGRQETLDLAQTTGQQTKKKRQYRDPRPHDSSENEKKAHGELMAKIQSLST